MRNFIQCDRVTISCIAEGFSFVCLFVCLLLIKHKTDEGKDNVHFPIPKDQVLIQLQVTNDLRLKGGRESEGKTKKRLKGANYL